jgi:hypothetical protein
MRLGLLSLREIIRRREHIDFTSVSESRYKLKTIEAPINGDTSSRAAVVIFNGDNVHGYRFVWRLY